MQRVDHFERKHEDEDGKERHSLKSVDSAPLPPVIDQPETSGSGAGFRGTALVLFATLCCLALFVAFAAMDDEEEAYGYVMPSPYVPVEHRGKRIVEQVHYHDGDRVEKGDLLLTIEANSEGLAVKKARNALDLAKSKLTSVDERYKAEIEQLKQKKRALAGVARERQIQVDEKRKEHERNEMLLKQKQGLVSQTDFELSLSALRLAQERLSSARDEVANIEAALDSAKDGPARRGLADLAEAKRTVEVVQRNLAIAGEELDKAAKVRAGASGTIFDSKSIHSGDHLKEGQRICCIDIAGQKAAYLKVKPDQVRWMQKGQRVRLESEEYPSKSWNEFHGTVSNVYSTPGEEGLYTVKVRIRSVPPEIELRPRSRARAHIAIERDLPVWRVLARKFGIAERQLLTKRPRKREHTKGDLLARVWDL